MKTVFHATIDGHEVVLGFGEAHIAPVETYAIIEPLVARLPEYVAAQAAGLAVAKARQGAAHVLSMAEQAYKRGRRTEADHLNAEYKARCREIDGDPTAAAGTPERLGLEGALVPLVEGFEAAKRELITAHAVYFHPREGEDLITDEQAAGLLEAWGEHRAGYALALDGTLIPDHRGRTYWRRVKGVWEGGSIDTLGLEPMAGAILESELTAEQHAEIAAQAEASRVAALSPEARDAEREQALQGAVARAAGLRSELEIAGDAEALAKSQAAYTTAAQEIAAKYGG